MKRLLSLVLAAVILASAVVTAHAYTSELLTSGDYDYVIDTWKKEVLIKKYNGSEKNVVIPSELGGYEVRDVESLAFQNCDSVETVTFPDTLEEISICAFAECRSLKEVYIPASVKKIDDSAFCLCTSMQNFHVDSGNSVYSDFDGLLCSKSGEKLCIFPSGRSGIYVVPESITILFDSCFRDCVNLEAIVIDHDLFARAFFVVTTSEYLYNTVGSHTDEKLPVYAHWGTEFQKNNTKYDVNFIPFELGDVNGDGRVTAVDSLLVQRSAVSLIKLSDEQKKLANVDDRSLVDNRDAMIILRSSIGLGDKSENQLRYIDDLCKRFNIEKHVGTISDI